MLNRKNPLWDPMGHKSTRRFNPVTTTSEPNHPTRYLVFWWDTHPDPNIQLGYQDIVGEC